MVIFLEFHVQAVPPEPPPLQLGRADQLFYIIQPKRGYCGYAALI